MRIALYQPDIPQNTGNILRFAACFDLNVDIIEPTGFIFDDKKLKRSLMDYIKHSKYLRYKDWNTYYAWCKKNKFRIILITTKSKKNYIKYKFKKNDILLFGRETAGVPKEIHKCANERLLIPMKNNLRSINVSNAVALVVGEAFRQLKIY